MMNFLRRPLAVSACLAFAGALPLSATASEDAPFGRVATYPVYQNVPKDVDPKAETNAEISTVTADGNTLIYTDAAGKRIGFLDITDPSHPKGAGSYDLAQNGHADDQPTSVAAYGKYVLVVIDQSGQDFSHPAGRLDVLEAATRKKVASIDLKGQPDSIAISPDGKYSAIAIENQRDEDAGDGGLPQLPAGFVQVIDLAGSPSSWQAEPINFTDKDGKPLPQIAKAGWDTPEDPEPEYVSINSNNQLAVTVQENNGVAIIDLPTRKITAAFSAGKVNLDGIDTKKDGLIEASGSLREVPREPDAIGWIDGTHVATANEGDWKGGSRGWTIFDTDGKIVWDSGTEIEDLATSYGLHNEKRAGKKGPEPEGLAIANYGGTPYAFVASERSNFVAVYDVSDASHPLFKQTLFTTNGPEGVLPIPKSNTLAISSEVDNAKNNVRASVGLYQLGAEEPAHLTSKIQDGAPIGWTALSGLSPNPKDPTRLYAISDDALAEPYIYTIENIGSHPTISGRITVTDSGEPASLDLEGIAARQEGGFWLANEGKKGSENALIRTDQAGHIVERVTLPSEVSKKVGKWGLEGVAAAGTGEDEVLYVALQRPLWKNPTQKPLEFAEGNSARIGRYQVSTKTWSWYSYPLEDTSTKGDWIGLSDIAIVDNNTLAVIERDKQNGPKAALKQLQTVSLDRAGGTDKPTPLTKNGPGLDLRGPAGKYHGWMQEKFEGLAVTPTCDFYVATDNDGLKDASGETYFFKATTVKDLLGRDSCMPSPAPGKKDTGTTSPTAAPETSEAPASKAPKQANHSARAGSHLARTGAPTAALLLAALSLTATGIVAYRKRS